MPSHKDISRTSTWLVKSRHSMTRATCRACHAHREECEKFSASGRLHPPGPITRGSALDPAHRGRYAKIFGWSESAAHVPRSANDRRPHGARSRRLPYVSTPHFLTWRPPGLWRKRLLDTANRYSDTDSLRSAVWVCCRSRISSEDKTNQSVARPEPPHRPTAPAAAAPENRWCRKKSPASNKPLL